MPKEAGSSPRVRGTLELTLCRRIELGIIPACAGNTARSSGNGTMRWDHPRVCGEHRNTVERLNGSQGSSPRVRGTRFPVSLMLSWVGIIPACAGNTRTRPGWRRQAGDHPRVCGEHAKLPASMLALPGSSPRVRGTLALGAGEKHDGGIIPACAGNTIRPSGSTIGRKDHPRVCGEHAWQCANGSTSMGSSPRVRGTLTSVGNLRNVQGIIPACAGNTKRTNISSCVNWDHPRVCGEHTS